MTTFTDKRNRITALLSAVLALTLSACGGSSPSTPAGECKEIPFAPTNLVATAKSSSEIELTWTASDVNDSNCAVSYRVLRGSDVIATSLADTTYTDNGLTPNTSYSYTVEAFDSAGKSEAVSAMATTQSVVIGGGGGGVVGGGGGGVVVGGGGGGVIGGGGGGADVTAPSKPTSLRVTNMNFMSVTLSWTAATDNVGVVGYDVSYGSTNRSVATNSVTIDALSASTAYTFTVKARDAAGNTSEGAQIIVTMPASSGDVTPPSAPGNLRTTNLTSMSVTLTWDASTDDVGVASYTVYDGTTWQGETRTTSVTLFNLITGQTYNFNIVARDAAGNVSSASRTVVVVPQAQQQTP